MELFVYTTLIDDIERALLSPIKMDDASENGLKGKSVIGYLKNPDKEISKDNVVINPDFTQVFQQTVKSTGLQSDELKNSARQQQNGYMYVIDQRAIHKDTKPYDIVGAFEVKNGQIIADSYQPNKNYEIISIDGLFKLPSVYEENILRAIAE